MTTKPCEICGAAYHRPYDDGLVECRENVRAERDQLRAQRDHFEQLTSTGQHLVVQLRAEVERRSATAQEGEPK